MKPVLVKVQSIQRNLEGKEIKLELISEGKFYIRNDIRYIVYEESELTEMKGVTTVIKILPDDTVILLRLGKVQQRQMYKEGKSFRSQYKTPFGNLSVTMKTYECNVDLQDGIGTILLGYDVQLEGLASNYTQLTITVQEDHS
ncbi:MAG: DUF1934 domain-containing protein [Megasphaera sp.]|nr:DUF1934 domain-containing protein [Megasphaera sp.]MCI1247516.1 DUF1934 domain-containing protein [Megasphaera sp.]